MTISLSESRVLVVGDVMLDRYWYGDVERISPEAPVPVVRITKDEERCGGAANVAANIVALGEKASLLSIVGEDEDGYKLESLVARTGVTPYFHRDKNLKTTVKLRVIGRQQQLIRLDFENTPKSEILLSQLSSFILLLRQHDAVLFSDYGKGGLADIKSMITEARSNKKPVFVDPKGSDYTRYRNATLITPNISELQQVIGEWYDDISLSIKVENLRRELSVEAILLTRGEGGMTLYDDKGGFHVNAQAREVFDVTGAGDTVIATMASLVAAGMTLREAVPYANRAGGIVVGKFGTATVSYLELLE